MIQPVSITMWMIHTSSLFPRDTSLQSSPIARHPPPPRHPLRTTGMYHLVRLSMIWYDTCIWYVCVTSTWHALTPQGPNHLEHPTPLPETLQLLRYPTPTGTETSWWKPQEALSKRDMAMYFNRCICLFYIDFVCEKGEILNKCMDGFKTTTGGGGI